jgi:hypothetical protein
MFYLVRTVAFFISHILVSLSKLGNTLDSFFAKTTKVAGKN